MVPETPEHRSWNMAQVKGKDTGPEMLVRRLVHSMGYRYRLHRKDLPGKPDLVFGPKKKVIEVHGCYWHAHLRYDPACKRGRPPKSNGAYWGPKLERNFARDQRNLQALQDLGFEVLTLWECELKDLAATEAKIQDFLT